MTYEVAKVISAICAIAFIPTMYVGLFMLTRSISAVFERGDASDKWVARGVLTIVGAFVLLYLGDPQFGALSEVLQTVKN